MFILTSISDKHDLSAEQILETLLGNEWFVFGDKNPLREKLRPDDQICFYMKERGVVAKASVASAAKQQPLPFPFPFPCLSTEAVPWSFRVVNVEFFFDTPVILEERLRTQLMSFRGKDHKQNWAWFVQSTKAVSEEDFTILTSRLNRFGVLQGRA